MNNSINGFSRFSQLGQGYVPFRKSTFVPKMPLFTGSVSRTNGNDSNGDLEMRAAAEVLANMSSSSSSSSSDEASMSSVDESMDDASGVVIGALTVKEGKTYLVQDVKKLPYYSVANIQSITDKFLICKWPEFSGLNVSKVNIQSLQKDSYRILELPADCDYEELPGRVGFDWSGNAGIAYEAKAVREEFQN